MGQALIVGRGGGVGSAAYRAWNDTSTLEHWTGKYLINPTTGARQKVYAKRVYATPVAGDNYISHGINNLSNKVSVRAILSDGTLLPKAHNAVDYSVPYLIFGAAQLLIYVGAMLVAARPQVIVDLEYTCTDR